MVIATGKCKWQSVRQIAIPCVLLVALLGVYFSGILLPVGDLSAAPQMVLSSVETANRRTLFVQKYELTVEQWNRCHDDGACSLRLKTKSRYPEATTPATGLNWFDVQQYVAWLNAKTRHVFRLPTSDEWSALAREVLPETPDPIFTEPELAWASKYLTTPKMSRKLRPIGSFKTTSDGISDLNGSVWEWTSNCYNDSVTSGTKYNCPAYKVGGEHVAVIPIFTRDPARGGCAVGIPPAHLGMRLVSEKPILKS